MSKNRVFSGPYFPLLGLNLLRKSSYSVQIRENAEQKKLRIWTLFTQFEFLVGKMRHNKFRNGCGQFHNKFRNGCGQFHNKFRNGCGQFLKLAFATELPLYQGRK